jgi:hypothetical protein
LTGTQGGKVVTFLYQAGATTGSDNIVVSLSDAQGGDDPITQNIAVSVTR